MGVAGFPANSEIDGFKASTYVIEGDSVRIAMSPIPGVTGVESAHARISRTGAVSIQWKPIPGALQRRDEMFAAIRMAGAIAIAEVIALPSTAADRASLQGQMAQAANSPTAIQEAHDYFRITMDDVTISSIQQASGGANFAIGDGSVRSIRQSLWNRIQSAMQFGVYGERWEKLPGVALRDIDGTAPGSINVFSFANMREMTSTAVPDPKAAQPLLDLIGRTEAAAKAADLPGAKAASKAFADAVAAGAALASPTIGPLGAIVFVGGWGSSMYQYAV